MKWGNFLHLYQPADQQPDILEAIVIQCYRPLISHIASAPGVKINLNISGALLELFDSHGYHDLLALLRKAGEEGKIEFTGSAKYHAFLPLLSEEDIRRQIEINDKTLKKYLGKAYTGKGFFPPEMGYDPKLVPILESMGFEWIILDEISYDGGKSAVDYTKVHRIKNSNLRVFFRERRVSNLIMSAIVRSPETFREAMKEDLGSPRYLVTAMDGETFGHHRPGLEKFLFDIFRTSEFPLATFSEIIEEYKDEHEVEPVVSTWASSREDIERRVQFLSWNDPENPIHAWQWELFYLVREHVRTMDTSHPDYADIEQRMDVGMASDHFWWASAKPWWSLEMIEDGAYRLLSTITAVPNVPAKDIARAHELYEKIVSTAFDWQRTGRIRQMMKEQKNILRIPFKDRTLGKGGGEEGVYHAFIDMMQRLEKEAAAKHEYEKAILWRDAVYKLENKLDIFDAVNAIDLLRLEIPHAEVEETIEKYKDRFRAIRGGQPEQRGN